LTPEEAQLVAVDYAQAAEAFAVMPQNTSVKMYNEKILPFLVEAYGTLNKFFPLQNLKESAKYDLVWWVKRRDSKTSNPMLVGEAMAKMYVGIFGKKGMKYFERAAYLRSVAGQYRDLAHDNWQGVTDNDWEYIETLLVKSYYELSLGMAANKS
jgi:hypothetical protein